MSEYPYIAAWGEFIGSSESFIAGQQALAERENAPENAIFKKYNGEWATFDKLSSYTQQMVETIKEGKEVSTWATK